MGSKQEYMKEKERFIAEQMKKEKKAPRDPIYHQIREKGKESFVSCFDQIHEATDSCFLKRMEERKQKDRERQEKIKKVWDEPEKPKGKKKSIKQVLQIEQIQEKPKNELILKNPVTIQREQYEFPLLPFELWYLISLYTQALQRQKLGRCSAALYKLMNQPCNLCIFDSNLHPHCDSVWRVFYQRQDGPYIDKYSNVTCRGLRQLCLRQLAESQFKMCYGTLKKTFCDRDFHLLKETEIKDGIKRFRCTVCNIMKTEGHICGKQCPKHEGKVCSIKRGMYGVKKDHECCCLECKIKPGSLLQKNVNLFYTFINYEGSVDFDTKDEAKRFRFKLQI